MFYVSMEGREPEVCTDAANAAAKASLISAQFGIDVDVIHQRTRDRVVIARAHRNTGGTVTNIVPPPEPPAPSPFDALNKNLDKLTNTIKEKL